ncbi:Hypothetical protein BN69_1073 [Methylocystis sp. SC2]|nr:Hypothetical protein BN69_1073 [Methylocystis sp. SC2]
MPLRRDASATPPFAPSPSVILAVGLRRRWSWRLACAILARHTRRSGAARLPVAWNLRMGGGRVGA